MNLENIRCPHCFHALNHLPFPQGEIHCPGCGASYAGRAGILDFIPEDDFYWGEIDRSRLRTINAQAEMLGDWYASISRNLTDRPRLINYITQPSRLGWLFHCYDPGRTGACLDVGSGWGSISFGLSRFYSTVYSLDRVFERLHFQSIRARLDRIDNVRFIRSDFLRLPFTDRTFDLVALNGVLEWVGMSDLGAEPQDLQRSFLEEIARVLKPGGSLYLGIENRLGYQYFLGDADHSGLRYTSLVPRRVADRMVRSAAAGPAANSADRRFFHKTQRRYRTYTYTLWGYQKMLSRAGFGHIAPYWAWQSYSYPRISGSLHAASLRYMIADLGQSIQRGWQKPLLRLVLALPDWLLSFVAKLISPDFLIVARRGEAAGTSLQERILAGEHKPFVRISRALSPTLETNYVLLDQNLGSPESVRVAARSSAPEAETPLVLAADEGVSGRLLRPSEKEDVTLTARWLAGFQEESIKGEWNHRQLEEEMHMLTEGAAGFPKFEDLHQAIRQFEMRYIQAVKSSRLGVVSEHGNFRPLNLVITPQDGLQPTDWRFSRERGVPFMDIGAFYLSLLRREADGNGSGVFPDTDGPLAWFERELGDQVQAPLSLTPVYFLLRVIQRVREGREAALFEATAFAELSRLLELALEHSLSRES